jgi:hypothetical protein
MPPRDLDLPAALLAAEREAVPPLKSIIAKMKVSAIRERLRVNMAAAFEQWKAQYTHSAAHLQEDIRFDLINTIFLPDNLIKNKSLLLELQTRKNAVTERLAGIEKKLKQRCLQLHPLEAEILGDRNKLLEDIQAEIQKIENDQLVEKSGFYATYFKQVLAADGRQLTALFAESERIHRDDEEQEQQQERLIDIEREIGRVNRQLARGMDLPSQLQPPHEVDLRDAWVICTNLFADLHQMRMTMLVANQRLVMTAQRLTQQQSDMERDVRNELSRLVANYKYTLEVSTQSPPHPHQPQEESVFSKFVQRLPNPFVVRTPSLTYIPFQPSSSTATGRLYTLLTEENVRTLFDKAKREADQAHHDEGLHFDNVSKVFNLAMQSRMTLFEVRMDDAIRGIELVENAAYREVGGQYISKFQRIADEVKDKTSYFKRHPIVKKILIGAAIGFGVAALLAVSIAAIWLTAGAAMPFLVGTGKLVFDALGLAGTIGAGCGMAVLFSAMGGAIGGLIGYCKRTAPPAPPSLPEVSAPLPPSTTVVVTTGLRVAPLPLPLPAERPVTPPPVVGASLATTFQPYVPVSLPVWEDEDASVIPANAGIHR